MAALRHAALCALIFLQCNHGQGLAEFELFPGFDLDDYYSEAMSTTTHNVTTLRPTTVTQNPGLSTNTTVTGRTLTTVLMKGKRRSTAKAMTKKANATTRPTPTSSTVKYMPYVCPEEETPLNIGPYEVPTQKDLVILMKKTLKDRFSSYHQKALYLLNDIKEATKATLDIEVKCPSSRKYKYKQCVKHVNNQCQVITKSLVTSLELQRHDVATFTEASVCSLTAVKADPVQLIKIVAMEEASLEFALPGFLRLLSACEHYCHKDQTTIYRNKPKRHMTDQDLVIKHFLTRKNYFQLMKNQ